jgi:transcriptional regulator GlxA family with amidase domain
LVRNGLDRTAEPLHDGVMQIAFVLYDRFTALDIVGPFQALVDLPGVDAVFVAEQAGAVRDHTRRLSLTATAAFADVPAPDVVVVPGGLGDRDAGPEHPVAAWLRQVHPTTTWTTSVCTGSIFLALAGILDGVDATTHWASYDRLAALGARPTAERVVERGKVITAAGVSAGIDMGLTLAARLYGDQAAQAIQLAIEYDPAPPFDAGSPAKAGPEVVALVRSFMSPSSRSTSRSTSGSSSS